MRLRAATVDDLTAINEIFNHYVERSDFIWALAPIGAAERARWFDEHGPAHPILVADDGEAVVGWGSLSRFHPRGGYARTVEDSVFVRSDRERRGIGAALLGALLHEAERLGHHAVLASIDAAHEPSLALHRRFGFVPVAHFREVGRKGGSWHDLVFLQRLL